MAKAHGTPNGRDVQGLARLLDSPEVSVLVAALDDTRWTGRPGYPIRTMVGMALVKSLYALPTWSRTVRLVAEHDGLRRVLGGCPSQDPCYRFTKKLRNHSALLDECIASVLGSLRAEMPSIGATVAIDGSDLPAYANGQRYVNNRTKLERTRYSDPDATWGHRSAISTRAKGSYYGYKVHAAVDIATGLPVAWQVETASKNETLVVPDLLDRLAKGGIVPEHAIMDRCYDVTPMYDLCAERGIRPVISLRETPHVKAGKHLPRTCEHGTWTFAGSDAKRGASKWRCPTGQCKPASEWVKADRLHPLIPRTTDRFKTLYHQRGAVEREFGRLKHEWAMLPLRVRRIERVRLHVDLTVLAQLATPLDKARAIPLAA